MNGLCSHERLQLALSGALNADEEATLHRHLDDCELCAAEMERLAGGERLGREIAAMLVPDELDEALPPHEECSTADFVVDHLEPSDDPTLLGRLGGYDVHDILGRGGMGVVLKGFDRELRRFVAIKTLAPHLAHSALARKRFAREAQAAAAVVNPHVIAIHQVQPNEQLPFLVMPLLTGESLAQRLRAKGTLELTEMLRIGMQAAEGLAAAHGQGLIHRDVKPANILLEKGVERAVLTDFGLARAADDVSMTRWGIIAGTPEYMSPEQARGEALDGRSDLFSLGCVLYEMATGVSPFRTDSTMATLRRIVDEQPAAMASLVPALPPWFSRIVERLLSKEPSGRFASASEVGRLLEQCLSHVQQPQSAPLPASLMPHAAARRSFFNRYPFLQASQDPVSPERSMTSKQPRSVPTSSRLSAMMIGGCLLGLVSAAALAAADNLCESILELLFWRPTGAAAGAHPLADLGTKLVRLSWAPLGVAAGTAMTLLGIQQATRRSGRSKVVSLLLLVTAITAGVAAVEMKSSVRYTQTVMLEGRHFQPGDDAELYLSRSVPAATRGWLLLSLAQTALAAAAITQVMSREQSAPQSYHQSKEVLAVVVLVGVFGAIVSWSWFSNGLALERTRHQGAIKASEIVGRLNQVLSAADWGAWALLASMTVLAVASTMSRSRHDSIAAVEPASSAQGCPSS